jgi:hypothetical protein
MGKLYLHAGRTRKRFVVVHFILNRSQHPPLQYTASLLAHEKNQPLNRYIVISKRTELGTAPLF